MSGPFSKHLLDSYQARTRGSHAPYSTYQPDSISTHGSTSFKPTMHGTYHPQDAFSCTPNDSAFFNLSADTEMKLAALQAKLNQKLGPEYISTRPGGNGMKLTYTEGWKVINLANEVFGFNGWSTAVVNVTCDFADYDPNTQRHTVGISATVRVTLRDGVYHEDVGYGMMENSKSKGAAFDKVRAARNSIFGRRCSSFRAYISLISGPTFQCRKEAVTDALKRALRNFGNLLGNCLYDKEYTKEIQKIKPPPPVSRPLSQAPLWNSPSLIPFHNSLNWTRIRCIADLTLRSRSRTPLSSSQQRDPRRLIVMTIRIRIQIPLITTPLPATIGGPNPNP